MDRPPRQAVDELFAALEHHDVPYLLVGGIALLHYVEGRNTEDIDLIMALAEAQRIPGLEVLDADRDFARARFGMLDVDLLLTENAFFAEVLEQQGTTMDFEDRKIRVVTAAGMLVLKLYALPSLYRQGNVAKVRLYAAVSGISEASFAS